MSLEEVEEKGTRPAKQLTGQERDFQLLQLALYRELKQHMTSMHLGMLQGTMPPPGNANIKKIYSKEVQDMLALVGPDHEANLLSLLSRFVLTQTQLELKLMNAYLDRDFYQTEGKRGSVLKSLFKLVCQSLGAPSGSTTAVAPKPKKQKPANLSVSLLQKRRATLLPAANSEAVDSDGEPIDADDVNTDDDKKDEKEAAATDDMVDDAQDKDFIASDDDVRDVSSTSSSSSSSSDSDE